MFSLQPFVNALFIELYGSHGLEKKLLLKEGFANSMNKIFHLIVKSHQ